MKTKYTKLLTEFSKDLNPDINLENLPENSSTVVTWKCSKNSKHIWTESVRRRCIQGYGCPYCSGHRTIKEESFAYLRPELEKEWDYPANGELDPYSIPISSNKVVQWKCDAGHTWSQQVYYRYRNLSGCKICRKIKNSLYYTHPEIAKEWNCEQNGSVSPKKVTAGSKEKIFWKCSVDPEHKWQSQVDTRTRKNGGCPFCRKKTAAKSRGVKLPSLQEYSPELAKQWHTTKNGQLTPSEVTAGSNLKVWWICEKDPNHEWKASVLNRARKGKGCPKCVRRNRLTNISKSVAKQRPDLVGFWDFERNGDFTPSEISCGSAEKIWWKCVDNPEHIWQERPYDLCKKKKTLCPFCRKLFNTLEFNYPEIAKEWHPTKNGELTPLTVTRANSKKVWWICSRNPEHEWQAEVKNRTIIGSGCPICAKEWNISRQQQNIYDSAYLNSEYFKIFIANMSYLKKFLSSEIRNFSQIRQPFFRMIYSSAITNLETYLSDAFFNQVCMSSDNLEKLILRSNDLSNKKYSPNELIEWKKSPEKLVSDYVYNGVLWHNLSKASHLYKDVLGIDFDLPTNYIYKAIATRHDLVHRNGKDKNGKAHLLSIDEVHELIDHLIGFVKKIDNSRK